MSITSEFVVGLEQRIALLEGALLRIVRLEGAERAAPRAISIARHALGKTPCNGWCIKCCLGTEESDSAIKADAPGSEPGASSGMEAVQTPLL